MATGLTIMEQKTKKPGTDKIKKFLSKELNEKELNTLYKHADIKRLQKKEIVIHQGEAEQVMYIILKGKVKIVRTIQGIKKTLTILETGDIFGEISFLYNKPRTATAIVVETTDLMIIDKETFDKFDNSIQLFFYKYISRSAIQRTRLIEKQRKTLELQNRQLITKTFLASNEKTKKLESSELINEIITKIPRLPVFAVSLAVKLAEENITPREIAREVKQDPLLAGAILKAINSSYYGLKNQVSDIHHAIMLLGYNEVAQIVIAEGVRRVMPKAPDFNELYNHSLAVSYIASTLSFGLNIAKPSEIGTIGLMHEFGQLVIMLLKSRNKKMGPLFDLVDTSQMGKILLQNWDLPKSIYRTIEHQFYPDFTTPDKIPEDIKNNVIILYFSHLCYHHLKGKQEEELSLIFFHDYLEIMNIERQSFSVFINKKVLSFLDHRKKTLPNVLIKLLYNHQKNQIA